MRDREWIAAVKAAVGIGALVPELGMSRGRQGSMGPCPACGASERGSGDRRGPLGATSDDKGWACHRTGCGAKGDALDLVSRVRVGKPSAELDAGGWEALRAACAAAGWCDPAGAKGGTTAGGRRSGTGGSGSRVQPAQRPTGSPSGRKVVPVGAVLGGRRPRDAAPAPADDADPAAAGGGFAWRPGLAADAEARLWSPEGIGVLAYLHTVRKIPDESARHFGLGCVRIDGADWLTIPLRDPAGEVINVRYRSIPPAAKTFRVCAGRPLPLFGASELSDDLGSCPIVVEGELDVVALHAYGLNRNVVSGTAGAKAWKDEWLDQLEPYSSFTLAYDDDAAGEEGAGKLADKLGRDRCARAILPRKDAGDCLAAGIPPAEVRARIAGAQPMLGTELCTAGSFTSELEAAIANPTALIGIPTGLRELDKALGGGIRPGLIVLTAETGHGKSTGATWLLWHLAHLGVPGLLTSFEQSPLMTAEQLLRSEVGMDYLDVDVETRRKAGEALDRLPLRIVKHRGHMPVGELVDIVKFSVRRLGVRIVLVDHLDYIVDPESEKEVQEIRKVCELLSIYAEREGVTIFLIVHPANIKQLGSKRRRVTMYDIKGASAIRQYAHEVWVLEKAWYTKVRLHPATWWHFDKIRSKRGMAGSKVLTAFDPLACIYGETWESTPAGRRGVRIQIPNGGRPPDEPDDEAPPTGGGRKKRTKVEPKPDAPNGEDPGTGGAQ